MRVDGQKMRTRREEMLLERSELAERLNVSYTTIYKMETRGHLPRLSTVKAIAKVLKLKPGEILVSNTGVTLLSNTPEKAASSTT